MAFLKQEEINNTYNYIMNFAKVGDDLYNIYGAIGKNLEIKKNNDIIYQQSSFIGLIVFFIAYYNGNIIYAYVDFSSIFHFYIYNISDNTNTLLLEESSQYSYQFCSHYLIIYNPTEKYYIIDINNLSQYTYNISENNMQLRYISDEYLIATNSDFTPGVYNYEFLEGKLVFKELLYTLSLTEGSLAFSDTFSTISSITIGNIIVQEATKLVDETFSVYWVEYNINDRTITTYLQEDNILTDYSIVYQFCTDGTKFTFNSSSYTDIKPTMYMYYLDALSFKGTINFADEDSVNRTFDYEVGYVETEYLYSSNCTFKFYDTSNELKTTIQHVNTDSYKYAETITINEEQYPINTKQQISLSSDFTIQVNNGAVAFYNVNFKNDSTILQTERLQEETIPTYKGATPVKAGYVFTGWTPTPYPVNKQQDYTATFEKEPYTITIADSGSNNFSIVWLDNQSTEKTREFSKPITSIRINQLFEPYSHIVSLILGFGDSESSTCLISYEQNNVIPQNFKIGGTTYNFGADYSVNIDSNTTINIVANTRYFIRFLNYDDSILETKYVYSGVTPTYTGDIPYQKGYNFTGWTPALYPADKNQDYKATFTIQTFTIRFLNDDGTELETKSVNYGVTPTYTGTTPTKEGYTFNGWTPVLYPANKNQDYTATYRNSAFALTLYKNSAENNRIDKTEYLTSVGEITGYLRNETNIINPSIVIEYTGVIDFNYVYISTFNRYYFVTNITSVRTNLWRLDMSCDTLMTYKETILNYECYVSRNENDYNDNIEDTYLPLEYEKVIEVTELYGDTTTEGKTFLESDYSVVFTTIYKGTEYEVIDEQVYTEFQDLEGNLLEVSSISLGASNYKCIGIIKNNILDNLNKLVEKTINDDTLASYIISLIVFPIDGDKLSDSNLNPSKILIKDDTTSMIVAQDDVSYPRGGILKPVITNQFTIKPKYNNFLDYEPYTTYEIYLPFYGWLKLNSYQILNEQLIVTYIPQVDSEQCTIIVSKGSIIGGSKEVIAEVTCQLGIQIPINSTNVERVNREKTANTLNSIVGTISGVAVAGAGAVTGNPLAVVGGASMAIGSLTSGLSKNMTMLPSAQSKTGSSYDGAVGDRTFKLRITYPKIAVDDISKYAKYIGRPLQTNVKLNTLTGYTIVGGVHVENLGTATDNEKTDIENQLRKGVII